MRPQHIAGSDATSLRYDWPKRQRDSTRWLVFGRVHSLTTLQFIGARKSVRFLTLGFACVCVWLLVLCKTEICLTSEYRTLDPELTQLGWGPRQRTETRIVFKSLHEHGL